MDIKETVKIMICPKCRGGVELKDMFISCEDCKLAYPVIEGVPNMLVEDVWKLSKAKQSGFRHTLKL